MNAGLIIKYYRIWQMGFFNCSVSLVSVLTDNEQVVGTLMGKVEDCQYVLLSVTVPPHLLIVSVMSN
jgi:hypothetical protein